MKMKYDPFPDTPAGFCIRVEETLMGLEEREMRRTNMHWCRLAAAAAVLLLLALGTAMAVVHGGLLRSWLHNGGEKLQSQVQDVHMTDADGAFSFTIDEALLEGDMLHLSYTVTVPEDGNVYLFSPYQLRLNGKAFGDGLDAEYFAKMNALGGEYGASVSQIMQVQVEPSKETDKLLDCKCVFMLAQRPLEKVDMERIEALCAEPNAAGNANQLMKNAEILYYTEGNPAPEVYLHYYPEVQAVFQAKGEDVLLAEELEETGIARQVCMLELALPIGESGGEAERFNDVMQHIYFMDGYTIEIKEFSLSHFRSRFEAVIRREDGGFTEWTEEEPFGQFYRLCNADGSDLGIVKYSLMGGGSSILNDGEVVYRVDADCGGVFPMEELTEIYLAPQAGDENRCDMRRAIRLMPFNNPNLPEDEPVPAADPAETDDLSS